MGLMGTIDSTLLTQVLATTLVVAVVAGFVVRASSGRVGWLLAGLLTLFTLVGSLAYSQREAARSASVGALREAVPDVAPHPVPPSSAAILGDAARARDRRSDPLAPYVSSDVCAACHPGQYASWHSSFHRRMTEVATPDSVLGRFDGQTLEAKGRHYRLQRRGDEYWVEMADPDWEADLLTRRIRPESVPDASAPRRWKRVMMTTGSHHMQTYWVASEIDGRLFNFPWLWLNEDQRWIPREDGFIRPPHGGRTFDVWHDSCIECHAVAGEKDFDARTGWNPRAAELGIACEACHGPADEHIRTHRNPLRRYLARHDGEPDPTITNPARLDATASSQVCGSCHGINMWRPGPLREGVRFRPGDDLRETRVIMRASAQAAESKDPMDRADWRLLQRQLDRVKVENPTALEERFWPDGMVRVSGREHNGMIESACFEGGDLTCLSCHSMHDSEPNDQLKRDVSGDQACLQCHPRFAKNVSTHTHHAPDSVGSVCQSCHMPHTVYGLLKLIKSHWIDSPSARTARDTGRSNACNLCHLDQSLGWSAQRLTAWYGQPRVELSRDQETIAEGIRQSLTGNAHQRAMVAWHMGRDEVKAASGEQWMGYFLAHLLDDPYPAVRYIAGHSLAKLGPGAPTDYDFLAEPEVRARRRQQTMAAWREAAQGSGSALHNRVGRLLRADGTLDTAEFERLARERDDLVMDLRE